MKLKGYNPPIGPDGKPAWPTRPKAAPAAKILTPQDFTTPNKGFDTKKLQEPPSAFKKGDKIGL